MTLETTTISINKSITHINNSNNNSSSQSSIDDSDTIDQIKQFNELNDFEENNVKKSKFFFLIVILHLR